MLILRRITRRCAILEIDMADMFSNSKSKAENSAEAMVLADNGEVEEVEIADDGGEDGPNAVRRRRREFLGWSGLNLEGILRRLILGFCFVTGWSLSCLR